MRCEQLTQWGRCSQPVKGLCSWHRRWGTGERDTYYEEKVVKGLLTPAVDLFSTEESRALMGGRLHGDGRRLDQWAIPDDVIDESDWAVFQEYGGVVDSPETRWPA